MADKLLGQQLYATGWRQGTLLSVLPWSVIYNANDPLTHHRTRRLQLRRTIQTRRPRQSQ